MGDSSPIIVDPWGSYVRASDDGPLFVSFDDGLTQGELPEDLRYCARVILPIAAPNENGGPGSPESETLWGLEDELCELLGKSRVRCRLIGRLTYGGIREIVFQLADWETFRPPVGWWMAQHEEYSIDVSEHEGWEFFDECLRPTLADRMFMLDCQVVDRLVDSGSDPEKPHGLEYAFRGAEAGLRTLEAVLAARGYRANAESDVSAGLLVMVKHLPLDAYLIAQESASNFQAADEAGVEFDGWGAAVER